MNIEVSDIHRTLEYRTDTTIIRGVPSALVLCLLGLVALAFDDPPAKIVFAGWVLVVAGIGWTGFALLRRSNPGTPLFVLSPKGILYRIPRVKEILDSLVRDPRRRHDRYHGLELGVSVSA